MVRKFSLKFMNWKFGGGGWRVADVGWGWIYTETLYLRRDIRRFIISANISVNKLWDGSPVQKFYLTLTARGFTDVYISGPKSHYDDVIMGSIASEITSLASVYSAVYSGADQRKHQSSASLAFVRGIHRGPQRASNAENVFIWWRHHGRGHCSAGLWINPTLTQMAWCWVYATNQRWRHYIPHYWSICDGNPHISGGFPSQRASIVDLPCYTE